MERQLSLIAALVAACVVVLLPGASFYVGYHSQRSILRTEAEINARLVTKLVNENPELWRVVVPRLEELLSKRPTDRTPEIRTLYDDQGARVAEVADALQEPLILETSPLHDAGRVVGHIAIARSLRPLLWQSAWFAALGALLGGGVFVSLMLLPVRALRRTHEQLQREATHDALTGLPNRVLFIDRLEQAMLRADRTRHPLALMFLDVDHFKDINDSLGHHTGDQVLRHIASLLPRCLETNNSRGRRSNDGAFTVARLGGDEFTILVESAGTAEQVSALAEQVLDALRAPLPLERQALNLSGSIGVALYPRDDVDIGMLMRHADMAMYQAKEQGRNTYHFFNQELDRTIQERIALDQALHGALERGEFLLHYQPRARMASGTVTGVEALLRWQRAGAGLVPPGEFITALEDNRLIVPVGTWVIETACAQLAAWDARGMPPLNMSVNLSARQFRDPELLQHIRRVLQATGIAPQRLELELTESLLMEDNALSRELLERLAAIGVRVAIDDFGTGYSSLAYLKRFEVDTLKLDRSFVRDLPHDADNGAIATAVVALARSLKLAVVCEGVETAAQRDFLHQLGCEEMQGFWLAPPLSADQLAGWLSGREPGYSMARPRPETAVLA